MVSIIIIIVGLSFLVFAHELGHFALAKLFKLRVDEFGFGLPPRAWGKKIGETLYSINWLPLGGFVKIYGEEGGEDLLSRNLGASIEGFDKSKSFNLQSAWKRISILLAGVFMNFFAGWVLLSVSLMVGLPQGVIITDVRNGSPAEQAGLISGDRVAGFKNSQEFSDYVKAHKGEEITLKVLRGDKEIDVKSTPRVNPPAGEGALGVGLADGGQKLGFLESFSQGFKITVYTIGLIFVGLYMLIAGLFTGHASLAGVMGPVGIANMASHETGLGLVYLLELIALISINLGAVNIIPFPALDGGRVLFILLEKIKGSPLPAKFERLTNFAGFALLILLMIAITARDVGNLL